MFFRRLFTSPALSSGWNSQGLNRFSFVATNSTLNFGQPKNLLFTKKPGGGLGLDFEEIKKLAKTMEEELSSKDYTAEAGGGLVKVTLNGKGECNLLL